MFSFTCIYSFFCLLLCESSLSVLQLWFRNILWHSIWTYRSHESVVSCPENSSLTWTQLYHLTSQERQRLQVYERFHNYTHCDFYFVTNKTTAGQVAALQPLVKFIRSSWLETDTKETAHRKEQLTKYLSNTKMSKKVISTLSIIITVAPTYY